MLIAALRAPMPRGFKWNFRDLNNGSALALAEHIGLDNYKQSEIWSADFLGMSGDDFLDIFCHPADDVVKFFKPRTCIYGDGEVTPAMIADALETYDEKKAQQS